MMLFTKVPGMTVFAPSSYQELQVQLADAVELCTAGPAMIRWTKQEAPSVTESEIGVGLQARKARTGTDVCILGVGKMFAEAIEAAERLTAAGISATVWDPRIVSPPDPEMIEDAAGHGLVITIEDGLRNGGAGDGFRDKIESYMHSIGADAASCEIRVLGMPRAYIPHDKPAKILSRYGLDAEGIVSVVTEALDR